MPEITEITEAATPPTTDLAPVADPPSTNEAPKTTRADPEPTEDLTTITNDLIKLITGELHYVQKASKGLKDEAYKVSKGLEDEAYKASKGLEDYGKKISGEIKELSAKLEQHRKLPPTKKKEEKLRELEKIVINLKHQIGYLKYQIVFQRPQLDARRRRLLDEAEEHDKEHFPDLSKENTLENSLEFKDFMLLYDTLTSDRKVCLLSFSVFPDNEIIRKRFVVYWWMAEGFLKPKDSNDKRTPEELATEVFQELMDKDFIQPFHDKPSLKIKWCRMHPFVRSALVILAKRAKLFYFDSTDRDIAKKEAETLAAYAKKAKKAADKAAEAENKAKAAAAAAAKTAATAAAKAENKAKITAAPAAAAAGGVFSPAAAETADAANDAGAAAAVAKLAAEHAADAADDAKKAADDAKKTAAIAASNAERTAKLAAKAEADIPAHYADSHQACLLRAERFEDKPGIEKIHILFNVDEREIDFEEPDTLFKMESLNILCLGRWQHSPIHHIELEEKHLEGIKNMKFLKFLSLQGISRIMELPGSIFCLPNLTILDLRACHSLELIPKEISQLKSLIHLDMSECYLLESMPREISALIELQVLKGFVVMNYSEDAKHCTVEHLADKLKNLVKLSIHTGREDFPNEKELKALNKLSSLRKLTVAWGRGLTKNSGHTKIAGDMENAGDSKNAKAPGDTKNAGDTENAKAPGVAKQSTMQRAQSKIVTDCYPKKIVTAFRKKLITDNSDPNLPTELEKLDLQSFPKVYAPKWLRASKLKKLKKLYIRGGTLRDLGQKYIGPERQRWEEVEILRVKYLKRLEMDWRELQDLFPKLNYLEKVECPKLTLFPCDGRGIWKKDPEMLNIL